MSREEGWKALFHRKFLRQTFSSASQPISSRLAFDGVSRFRSGFGVATVEESTGIWVVGIVGHRPTITDFSSEDPANRIANRLCPTGRKCDGAKSRGEFGSARPEPFRFFTPFSLVLDAVVRN